MVAMIKKKTRRSPKRVYKTCLYCGATYKGSAQSNYCSKYHMECASRARREALLLALSDFFVEHAETLTRDLLGQAVSIKPCQAKRKAEQCIEANYVGFKRLMLALGYVYDEHHRIWEPRPLLAG